MITAFSLDSRLAADTVPVADLPLSTLRLMNDATYPWLILVPRREAVTEIIDLEADERQQLIEEIATVSALLRDMTRCDKLNVGALGNMVPQLHVHVIGRFHGDPAWPGPVWGKHPPKLYADAAREGFVAALRARLSA
jgi:diadenosine tetraphosphate (Ap4A) HIT family hydrolase